MLTRRVFAATGSRYWVCCKLSGSAYSILIYLKDEPSSTELVFIILNYVACVPVLLAVGGFRYFLEVALHVSAVAHYR